MEVIIVMGVALIYFIPTIVSVGRRAKRQAGIFLINLLLGWTLLGWVGALVWAVSDNTEMEEN